MEIKLSQIRHIDIKKLKVNGNNEKFFRPAEGAELDQFVEDVKTRGIQNPLIIKKDYTILAGHKRRLAALKLKFDTVPCQLVVDELTPEQEIEYLIKDNVLRRHLTPEERRKLYNYIIPDFEEAVKHKRSGTLGVNAAELAEKTGLNSKTVNYDLTHIRQKKEKERISKSPVDIADEKAIENYKKSITRMLNVSILGSEDTNNEFIRITKSALERLESNNIKIAAQKEQTAKPRVLK